MKHPQRPKRTKQPDPRRVALLEAFAQAPNGKLSVDELVPLLVKRDANGYVDPQHEAEVRQWLERHARKIIAQGMH